MPVNAFDPNNPNNNQTGQGTQSTSSGGGSSSSQNGYNVSGSSPAPSTGGSGSTSSTQGSASSPSQTGPQNTANPQGTSSGNFTNLQSYLNANQSYNNGQGLAGQVNNNLQNQGQQIQNTANQQYQNFNNQANQGYTQYDPNNQIVQDLNGAVNNPSTYGQSTLSTDAANTNNANSFNSMLQDQYTGPTNYDPNATLANQVQNFQQEANQTQSEPGRISLLGNMFGAPNYNQGQQTLDNLFLQSQPNQIAQLQQATNLGNNLSNTYNNFNTQAQQTAQQDATNASNTAQQVNALLGNAVNAFGDTTNPNSYVNNLIAQGQAAQAAVKQAAQSGNFTQDQLNNLGLSVGQKYGNVPLSQYIQDTTLNNQNVLGANDNATLQALSNLAGTSLTGAPQQMLAQYLSYNPQQAANPYSFNKTGFDTAYGNSQNAYNSAANPINSKITSDQNTINSDNSQINSDAQKLQAQLQAQATLDKEMGIPNGPDMTAISKLTPLQILQQYGATPTMTGGTGASGNYTTTGNPYTDLINNYNTTEADLTPQQAALASLANQYGLNNTIGLQGSGQTNEQGYSSTGAGGSGPMTTVGSGIAPDNTPTTSKTFKRT